MAGNIEESGDESDDDDDEQEEVTGPPASVKTVSWVPAKGPGDEE